MDRQPFPGVVSFSRNLFIPATTACRDRCTYCTFRSDPGDPGSLMTPEMVARVLRDPGGASEALFVTGQSPEENPVFRERLRKLGYDSLVDYAVSLGRLALEHGLLPHSNLGVLTLDELRRLREVNASLGLMLECAAPLECHAHSPSKDPRLRLRVMEDAGRLRIPFTTGILMGIGETPAQRRASLEAIARVHRRYGHIQEVILQPFWPKEDTPMRGHPRAEETMVRETLRMARRILPPEVALQVPPNLASPELVFEGANDLGGISTRTLDYINPEAPWPRVEELCRRIRPAHLRERLPIYPRYVQMGWYSSAVAEALEPLADEEGFRRTPAETPGDNTLPLYPSGPRPSIPGRS
ncbi:MAG: 7,8-didemethyl-8-hydroxy-5-deazariboflavin synthase subunit CofG [Euryarchaeota archaeon]|nr:7,8-didemethyl-8-hydroxy-5-deazariboflavin synthase subunit CofG [Euryarchaeota archaeon]